MLEATASLSNGLPACTARLLGLGDSIEPSSCTRRTLTTTFCSTACSSVTFGSWAHPERPARQQASNKIARNPLEQRSFRRIFSQTKGSTGALPLRTPCTSLDAQKGRDQLENSTA